MNNKEDMTVYDEVQCEEGFQDEDRYGMSRPKDEEPEAFGLDDFYDINE